MMVCPGSKVGSRPGVYVDTVFGQDNRVFFVYNALKYMSSIKVQPYRVDPNLKTLTSIKSLSLKISVSE